MKPYSDNFQESNPSQVQNRQRHRHHLGKLAPAQAALYMEDDETPIIVDLKGRVTLGRPSHGNTTILPEVAFNDADMASKGVSRLHATLERISGVVTILDEYSTNGTYVNGRAIPPMAATTLHDGDEIRLANLRLYIYFNS